MTINASKSTPAQLELASFESVKVRLYGLDYRVDALWTGTDAILLECPDEVPLFRMKRAVRKWFSDREMARADFELALNQTQVL